MSAFLFAGFRGSSLILADLLRGGHPPAAGAKIGTVPVLLAAASRGDSLSESFRSHAGMGRDDVLLGLLMVAALVAGLWAASRLLGLRRRRRGYSDPWQLFRALGKAHHLTWSDRALLARLARHHGLRDPGRLFLESQFWDEQRLGHTFALDFVRLGTLRKQIFQGPAPSGAEAGRAVTSARVAGTSRNLDTMLSGDGRTSESPQARDAGFSRKSSAEPSEDATTNVVQPPEAATTNIASPLFAALPAPTLDVPPWTQAPSIEG